MEPHTTRAISGIGISAPAALVDELAERLLTWANRNLVWLLREDAASVASLCGSAPVVSARELGASLLALRGGEYGIEHLLQAYGASFEEPVPTLASALDALEQGPLLRTLRNGAVPLRVFPNRPGEPAAEPRLACVFLIDEWPMTPVVAKALRFDPQLRDCACWIYPETIDVDLLGALPEEELPGARYDAYLYYLSELCDVFLEDSFSQLLPIAAQSRAFGIHTNASKPELAAYLDRNGYQLLTVPELLAADRAQPLPSWQLLSDTPQRWNRLATSLGESAAECSGSSEGTAETAVQESPLWERLGSLIFPRHDVHDCFGIVLAQLAQEGAQAEEAWSRFIPQIPRYMSIGSWAWYLASAPTDRALQQVLLAAGYSRGHARCTEVLFRAAFRDVSLSPPQLEIPFAPAVIPGRNAPLSLDAGLLSTLNSCFPIDGDRFLIHLGRVEQVEDGCELVLHYMLWEEDHALSVYGLRTSELEGTWEENAQRVLTGCERLSQLSYAAFKSLVDDHAEDFLAPFVEGASLALRALVDELFPLTLSDGATLSVRRLVESDEGVTGVFQLVAPEGISEVERAVLAGPLTADTEAELRWRTARWRALSYQEMEQKFWGDSWIEPCSWSFRALLNALFPLTLRDGSTVKIGEVTLIDDSPVAPLTLATPSDTLVTVDVSVAPDAPFGEAKIESLVAHWRSLSGADWTSDVERLLFGSAPRS